METNTRNNKENPETGMPQKSDPQDKNIPFSDFVDNAKASFERIWANSWLWFWGIFLPLGGGVSLNIDFNNFKKDEKVFGGSTAGGGAEQFFAFLREYLVWVIVGASILIVLKIVCWIISAIARRGVIQALHQLQTPTQAATFNFREIWRVGKVGATKLLLLDVATGLAMLVLFLVLGAPILLLIFGGNIGGAVAVGIVALLIIVPAALLIGYIKETATIFLVLSEQKVLRAAEAAYALVSRNIVSALKLLLANIGLGVVRGFVSFAAFFVLGIIGVIVAASFGLSVGGYEDLLKNPGGNVGQVVALGVVGAIALLVALAAGLIIKGFFSLWQQDLWLWWVKRLGGEQTQTEEVVTDDEAAAVQTETVPTTNSEIE